MAKMRLKTKQVKPVFLEQNNFLHDVTLCLWCLPGFVASHSGEVAPLMPISSSADQSCLSHERVKVTVNSKKETNGRVKMGQGVKMGCCCLPP